MACRPIAEASAMSNFKCAHLSQTTGACGCTASSFLRTRTAHSLVCISFEFSRLEKGLSPGHGMTGVGEHVKNRQGNNLMAFRVKTSTERNSSEARPSKYSKSVARASGLQETYRILSKTSSAFLQFFVISWHL